VLGAVHDHDAWRRCGSTVRAGLQWDCHTAFMLRGPPAGRGDRPGPPGVTLATNLAKTDKRGATSVAPFPRFTHPSLNARPRVSCDTTCKPNPPLRAHRQARAQRSAGSDTPARRRTHGESP